MRDLFAMMAALALVRVFWVGIVKAVDFYQRYYRYQDERPEVPPLRRQ